MVKSNLLTEVSLSGILGPPAMAEMAVRMGVGNMGVGVPRLPELESAWQGVLGLN